MSYKAVKAIRQRRKEDLVYIMGGKCVLCGYDKCMAALEFHHIDKSKKERQLSTGNYRKWEDDVEEVKKCALVCSNCHREIEAFGLEVDISFDQEKYEEITTKKMQEKERKINYCRKCGVEINQDAFYCKLCWPTFSRKVERPSREELKDLIRNNSFLSLSEMFDVSDNAIRKWCKKYQLPHRISDIKLISDEDWELI